MDRPRHFLGKISLGLRGPCDGLRPCAGLFPTQPLTTSSTTPASSLSPGRLYPKAKTVALLSLSRGLSPSLTSGPPLSSSQRTSLIFSVLFPTSTWANKSPQDRDDLIVTPLRPPHLVLSAWKIISDIANIVTTLTINHTVLVSAALKSLFTPLSAPFLIGIHLSFGT